MSIWKHFTPYVPYSKHREVVQEKISGLNSLQSLSNLAQKRLSGVANCWLECVGVFLNRSLFLSEYYISFMCCWTVTKSVTATIFKEQIAK